MTLFVLLIIANLQFEAKKMEILSDGTSRATHLIGDVHLFDAKIDIRGAEALFAPSQQSLIVWDSLRIKAQDADITADSLRFDTENRISYLYRRVVVKRGNTEIRAPELVIDHRTSSARIPFGARIKDLNEDILITGDDVEYNLAEDKGMIKRNPRLSEDTDSSDFSITSQRMYIDQSQKTASGAGNVHIKTRDADVYCDTLALYYEQDKGHAFGNTRIKSSDGTIEADSADFKLKERNLEEIFLYPLVVTRYRTEGKDSVVLQSAYLTMDLSQKNHEILIFTGGANGTYFWQEEAAAAEQEE